MKNNFFSQRRINPVYQTIFFKGKQSFPFLYKYFMLAIGMRGRDVYVNVILCYKFCNDITYVVAHNALSYQIGKIFIFKINIQTIIIIYRDIFQRNISCLNQFKILEKYFYFHKIKNKIKFIHSFRNFKTAYRIFSMFFGISFSFLQVYICEIYIDFVR